MREPRPFHRLFGLSWMDFFQGTAVSVEPETDLSRRQQWLDLVLTREGNDPIPWKLPDGFDRLVRFNLITFKSFQEALESWALCELVAHYVNYRKQISESMHKLLPESDFRLFAVCVRFPEKLYQDGLLKTVMPGVYDVACLGLTIRVIVVQELPQEEQNAMLLLFSARQEQIRYGKEHYRPRSPETSSLLYQLFKAYQEDPEMATQLEEFVQKTMDEILKKCPPEKRLEGLSPEERLEGLSPEERLEGLSPEERLEGLSPEEIRALLEAAQRRLQANGSSPNPS